MRALRILGLRLRSLLHRRAVEADLERELSIHLDQLTGEFMAEGSTEHEARLAARRKFGALAPVTEECRDTRGTAFLEDLAKDVVYAFRHFAKSPAFTLTAVLSLAIGVGANTAIFSLVKRVVFDLLPVRDPASLVYLSRTDGSGQESRSFSYPFLRDLQNEPGLPVEAFIGVAGMGRATLLTESGAEPVSGEMVTGNYFEALGVRPSLGRVLTPDDDRHIGGHPVVVLSYHFWKRRFGADPAVLNTTVRINAHPYTIIGVSAQGFDGMTQGTS